MSYLCVRKWEWVFDRIKVASLSASMGGGGLVLAGSFYTNRDSVPIHVELCVNHVEMVKITHIF